MELFQMNQQNELIISEAEVISSPENNYKDNEFLGSNTQTVTLEHLRDEAITPVFAKDGAVAISHPQFIDAAQRAVLNTFPDYRANPPVIKASHLIQGRIASALSKSKKDLLDSDVTFWYERCAFIIKVPGITQIVNGNELTLTVGGVRAFNKENLYSKKSMERFSVFIGFVNKVCTNLVISTDGFKNEIRVSNVQELQGRMELLFQNYDLAKHLGNLERLSKFELNIAQFAHFVGRLKMYHHLNSKDKKHLFPIPFNETMINSIAKNYYQDPNFSGTVEGNINLWQLFNLMTGAVKSSYIDSFLKRNAECMSLSQHLANKLQTEQEDWYLI